MPLKTRSITLDTGKSPMPLRRSCIQCETKGPHCFCSLDRVALQRLDGLGNTLRLNAHELILREGYAPEQVYIVCHGTIKLTTSSSDGRLLLLRIVGPGDVLGLAAALKRSRYEATAETLEPCELKSIPRTHFLLFMEEFQAAGRNSVMAMAREYDSAVLSARRLALSSSAVIARNGSQIRAAQKSEGPELRYAQMKLHTSRRDWDSEMLRTARRWGAGLSR